MYIYLILLVWSEIPGYLNLGFTFSKSSYVIQAISLNPTLSAKVWDSIAEKTVKVAFNPTALHKGVLIFLIETKNINKDYLI